MKRTARILFSTMLVLMFVFSFAGAAPALAANDESTLSAKFYSVTKGGDGAEDSYADMEGSADFGNEEEEEPTIAGLKEHGVVVDLPEACYVDSVTLSAPDETDEEKILDLSKYAVLAADELDEEQPDRLKLYIPASAFADEVDDDETVHNILDVLDSSETYVLSVYFCSIEEDEEVKITCTDGALDGELFDPEEIVVGEEGYEVQALSDDVQETAIKDHCKAFSGWKLIYPSGISMEVSSGDTLQPFTSCELAAQWDDVIVVTVDNFSKPYDGTPLAAADHFTVSGKEILAEGEEVSVTFEENKDSITNVGTLKCTPIASVVKDGEQVDGYTICVYPGDLTVTPRPLTVTVDDNSKPYDGTPLTASSAKVTEGSLVGDHQISYTFSGTQTVPGTGEGAANATATIKSGDTDVTGNYNITVVPGNLSVTQLSEGSLIELTIAPKDATAEYDGTAHGASDYQIVSGKLPEGVTITVTYGNERTDAGEGETSIGLVTFLQDGADVTANFNVTANTGKITISQRPITITADSATKEYDSKALTKNTYTVSENSLLSNHNVTAIEIVGSQTEVGTSKNTIKENSVKITDGEGNDVTKNYAITLKDGTLEVTKRPITITAESAAKEFDGKPLTQNTAKVTSGSLLTGHKVSSIVIEGSQTEVGKARNIIKSGSVKIVDAQNNDVTKNYAITLAEGILEVTGKTVTDITVTVNESKVYDGTALTLTADKIKVNPALPSGYTISATFSTSSRTDAGSDEITLTNIAIKDASGNNVSAKYNIKVEKGKLEVTKRPLTVTTGDKTKVYDGKELTDRTVPTIEGQLSQHNIELKFTGTQTKVGSSDNSVQILSIKDKETKADVTANYEITYKFGKLTVTSSTGVSGSGSNSGSNSKPTVNTGDTNNIWIWILLMVAAAGAAVAVVIFVRKSKKNGDDPTDPTGNDQNK